MEPMSNVNNSSRWLTKEPEKHTNEKKYSTQAKKFKHSNNNIESHRTEKLTNNDYHNEMEKNRTKIENRNALSEKSKKSTERSSRKKRLKRNSTSSKTVTPSSSKKLNEIASSQSNTILKWVTKSINNSPSSSTEKNFQNLSISNETSNIYSNKFQTKIKARDSVQINNIAGKKNYKTKLPKEDIEINVTRKNKKSNHTLTEPNKNLQERRSPVHIKSSKLIPDKCSVSKTLFPSFQPSDNLSTKSNEHTTKNNSKNPLSNEVSKKYLKNGLDNSKCKSQGHRNTNKLKINRQHEDVNMTFKDKTKLNKQDNKHTPTKKKKHAHHTPTEEKKSLPIKSMHIKLSKLSSNESSVSKTHFLLGPQSGSISTKSSKYTTKSNSNSLNEVTQKSHESGLDNLKYKIKAQSKTNKLDINQKKRDNMTPMDKISTKNQKNCKSKKQIVLQTLDGYLNRPSEKCKKRKFSKREVNENCEIVVSDKKRPKSSKSNDTFKKYGVAVPSVEEILKEQNDFVQYKNQLESFQHIIDENKFDLPFSVKTSKNSKVIRQNVLDCKYLTTQEIEKMFYNNLDYISAIFNGETDNERHTRFFSTNVKSYTFTVKDLCYNTSTIVFTFEQQEHMIALLKKEFDPSDRWNLYFFQVLLPELCLKIFMDTHRMGYDEAVEYLDTRPILDD